MDETKTPLWIKDFESTFVAQYRHGQWNYRIPRQALLNAVENGRVYPAKYAKERTADHHDQGQAL